MRCIQTRVFQFTAAMVVAASCSNGAGTGARPESVKRDISPAALPDVRITELHYDSSGTNNDQEAVEISGPAGMDVTGWKIVLYDGTGGASYNTQTLNGSIPTTCGTRGVLVVRYDANAMKDGGT